jgi:hypothetical protein
MAREQLLAERRHLFEDQAVLVGRPVAGDGGPDLVERGTDLARRERASSVGGNTGGRP